MNLFLNIKINSISAMKSRHEDNLDFKISIEELKRTV